MSSECSGPWTDWRLSGLDPLVLQKPELQNGLPCQVATWVPNPALCPCDRLILSHTHMTNSMSYMFARPNKKIPHLKRSRCISWNTKTGAKPKRKEFHSWEYRCVCDRTSHPKHAMYATFADSFPLNGSDVGIYYLHCCGSNQCYHFGVGAPPILVYFSGEWGFTGGTGFSPMATSIVRER